MKLKPLILLVIFFSVYASNAYSNSGTPAPILREFAFESLVKVLLSTIDASRSQRDTIADAGGLIILLSEIDEPEATNILLQLVEVYVGSANAEALSYAITRKGKSIRDDLNEMLSRPVECALLRKTKYVKLQCLNRGDRDRKILWLLELIDSGSVPEYEL